MTVSFLGQVPPPGHCSTVAGDAAQHLEAVDDPVRFGCRAAQSAGADARHSTDSLIVRKEMRRPMAQAVTPREDAFGCLNDYLAASTGVCVFATAS
jgi:hypothetical protein